MNPRLANRSIGLLIAGIAIYYAVWGGEYSAFDLRSIAQRQQQERERVTRGRLEVDSLRALTKRLESDRATLETVARERFGMIRSGEILYRFVGAEEGAQPAADPSVRP